MARKNIQGITIEIGGDTTKLQSALRGVENKLKDTQNALRDVNKLLKMDPGNVELLTQKQNLLKESIQETEEKLETLRDAADQANEALANGDIGQAEYDALQREIVETEQQLKGLKNELKDFGSVAKQQLQAASDKVKEFGGKVTEVGTNLTKYVTGSIAALGTASVKAFNEVDEGFDTIVKKTGKTGDELLELQGIAENLATSIPTDFSTAGNAVAEVSTRFDLTGESLENLSRNFIKFADLNNTDVVSSIDSVQTVMAAFGVDTEDALAVLNLLNKASQDTGTDVSKLTSELSSNAATLQEMGFGINRATGFLAKLSKNGLDSSAVLTGMNKALKNATKEGKSMSTALADMERSIVGAKTETEAMRNATELFGANAAPAIVKALRDGRLSFEAIDNTVKDFKHSVNDTFDATQDPLDEFKMALNELKIAGMELVEAAGPMLHQLASTLQDLFANLREWWEGLSPAAQETIIKAAAIAAALGPVLMIVGSLITAIGALMSPIGLVVVAIGALVAAGVALWKNWDKIKDKAKKTWDNIKNTIKNVVDKIKSFFSFQWELPKIPLPHFKIEGSFSIAPPRVPHLSIDWYKKAMADGMILSSPTVLPAANGNLRGFGDAGPEAVVGVSSLRSMINNAVSAAMPRSGAAKNMTVILELNGSEFARTTVPYIDAEVQRLGSKLTAR